MKKRLIAFLILSLVIIFSSHAFASDRFIYMYSNDLYDYYLDTETAYYVQGKTIFHAWTKVVFNDNSRQLWLEKRRKNGENVDRFENIGYILSYNYYDKEKRAIQLRTTVYYDTDGKFISRKDYSLPYRPLAPETDTEKWFIFIKNYLDKK